MRKRWRNKGPVPPTYQSASRFDDVWNRDSDICAYCAQELDDVVTRCPGCGRNLEGWHYRYPRPSTNLHILWVLLVGAAQLFFAGLVIAIMRQGPVSLMVLDGAAVLVLLGLAVGVYFRQFWAYVMAIVTLLVLLFLSGRGTLAVLDLLPETASPAGAMIVSPFASTLTTGLTVLQMGTVGLALLYAVFLAGPDFDRVKVRFTARVERQLKEASGFYQVGRRYARRGMWATAVLHWQRAAAHAPTKALYQRRLGQAYARLGFHERSLDVLRSALDLTTDPAGRAKIEHLIRTVRQAAGADV